MLITFDEKQVSRFFSHCHIVSYIDMCNQVAFTNRLPLYPCKFSYWLVSKHAFVDSHYELVGLPNYHGYIRVYRFLTNRFAHFFPNIACRKPAPTWNALKDNQSRPNTGDSSHQSIAHHNPSLVSKDFFGHIRFGS